MRAVEVSTKKLSWLFLGLVMLAHHIGSPRHIDWHGDLATERQSGDLQGCSQEPAALGHCQTRRLGQPERLETTGG